MLRDFMMDGRNLIAISGFNAGIFFFADLPNGNILTAGITLVIAFAGLYYGYNATMPIDKE